MSIYVNITSSNFIFYFIIIGDAVVMIADAIPLFTVSVRANNRNYCYRPTNSAVSFKIAFLCIIFFCE